MGGPSAALVLGELAKLGVRRAIRIGTCAGRRPEPAAGELLLVERAIADGGSAPPLSGSRAGEAAAPDPALTERLRRGARRTGARRRPSPASTSTPARGPAARRRRRADMQTVAVLARAGRSGIAAAAVLIVAESGRGAPLADEIARRTRRSWPGDAAATLLSP